MRINGYGAISSAKNGAGKASSKRGRQNFKLPGESTSHSAPPTSSAPSVSHVGHLIALQEVDERKERRKKAIHDSTKILDILDELKIGLLSGRMNYQQLVRLKNLIDQLPQLDRDDPASDVLYHIDLRARVELAKLGG